jgi:hypothetical protein
MLIKPETPPTKDGHSFHHDVELGKGKGKGKARETLVPFVSPLLVAGDTQLPCDDIRNVAFVLEIKLMGLG